MGGLNISKKRELHLFVYGAMKHIYWNKNKRKGAPALCITIKVIYSRKKNIQYIHKSKNVMHINIIQ